MNLTRDQINALSGPALSAAVAEAMGWARWKGSDKRQGWELTAHPERASDIAAFLNGMIRSYLEPIALATAERAL
jgi:hypothetical protein